MTGLTLFYHPLSSYCWKALIALHENGTDVTLRLIDFGKPEDAAELEAAWPMKHFPVLRDAAAGLTLPESSVIIEYVATRYPGGFNAIPDDAETALEVRLLDRLFDFFVMTPMQAVVFDHIRPDGSHDPLSVSRARGTLEQIYPVLEARLAGRQWAAGDSFSLADCAAMPSLHYAQKVAPFRAAYPGLGAYLDRLEARPSVQRVLEAAAPYAHMFPVK